MLVAVSLAPAGANMNLGTRGFEGILERNPRPERRLSESEAMAWGIRDAERLMNARVFRSEELIRLSQRPSTLLHADLRNRPTAALWVTFELFVRRERASLEPLMDSARRGNAWAPLAIKRIEAGSERRRLRELVRTGPPEVQAVAGVLLGELGDRAGVPGMRLAADRFPEWRTNQTIEALITWEDRDNVGRIRRYVGGIDGRYFLPLLRRLNTPSTRKVLLEQAQHAYQGNRTWAMREIRQMKDPRVRPAMRRALQDPYPHLRLMAGEWFLENGTVADAPFLQRSLNTTPAQEINTREGAGWRAVVREAIQRSGRRR